MDPTRPGNCACVQGGQDGPTARVWYAGGGMDDFTVLYLGPSSLSFCFNPYRPDPVLRNKNH
jgi:hypothetical protein